MEKEIELLKEKIKALELEIELLKAKGNIIVFPQPYPMYPYSPLVEPYSPYPLTPYPVIT